jgi:Transmembrane secretion effector/FAD binding domain
VTDVVIAGYGPAGAAAAIAAHDAGRSVLILESAERGGGNARYSGGFLFDVPGNAAIAHLDALCFGRTDRRVLEAYAAGLHELDGWLRSLGGTTAPFEPPPARLPAPFPSWPHLPTGHRIRYRTVAGGTGRRGEALWDLLEGAVRARGIEVRYRCAAERLLLGPHGSVTGGDRGPGRATSYRRGNPGPRRVRGRTRAGRRVPPVRPVLAGRTPGEHRRRTGDGAAGRRGAVAHVRLFGWFAFRTPDFPAPFAVDFFGASHVFTDADGRRFADETGNEVHDRLRALLTYLPRNPNRPRLPSWAVFDEVARRAGPLNGLLGTPNDYAWSPDNSAEIDRGWILAADGPPGLTATPAARAGMPAAAFEAVRARQALPRALVPGDVAATYGVLLFASGAGGVIGGVLLEVTGRIRPTVKAAVVSTAVYGVTTVFFALTSSYLVALAMLLLGGIANLASMSIGQTIVQLLAPPADRGRVIGLYGVSANGLRAGSGFTVGILGAAIGIHWSLGLSAVALCLGTLAAGIYALRGHAIALPVGPGQGARDRAQHEAGLTQGRQVVGAAPAPDALHDTGHGFHVPGAQGVLVLGVQLVRFLGPRKAGDTRAQQDERGHPGRLLQG